MEQTGYGDDLFHKETSNFPVHVQTSLNTTCSHHPPPAPPPFHTHTDTCSSLLPRVSFFSHNAHKWQYSAHAKANEIFCVVHGCPVVHALCLFLMVQDGGLVVNTGVRVVHKEHCKVKRFMSHAHTHTHTYAHTRVTAYAHTHT